MLSSTTNRTQATGNDSTAVYNYGFRIRLAADLLVTVRNIATNVESVLTLTTDYTVSGIGQATGSITLVNAGQAWMDGSGDLATGYIIVIRRVLALQQNTSIRNQSNYYASVHEDEFDTLTMMIQQLNDYIQRAVTLPETVLPTAFNPVLPSINMAAPVPGSILQVNPAGTGFTFGSPQLGWNAVSIGYGAFSAASTQSQINAFSLPAGCALMGVVMKHSIAFSGGAVSAVAVDLGISGTADLFLTAFDVFQAVSDTAFVNAMVQNIQSFANPTNIMVRATSTSANLNALTAGTVTIYYWFMNL